MQTFFCYYMGQQQSLSKNVNVHVYRAKSTQNAMMERPVSKISGPGVAYSPQPRHWTLICKMVSLKQSKLTFNWFHGCKPAVVREEIQALGLYVRNIDSDAYFQTTETRLPGRRKFPTNQSNSISTETNGCDLRLPQII